VRGAADEAEDEGPPEEGEVEPEVAVVAEERHREV
jgi:hypothetical protein